MSAAPADTSWAAVTHAGASVRPPGRSSCMPRRTNSGKSAPARRRTAASTSRCMRLRRSWSPPSSSARWFVSGERNCDSRNPWAAWISTASNPARCARAAAPAKASTASSIWGRVNSAGASGLLSLMVAMGEGASTGRPVTREEARAPAWEIAGTPPRLPRGWPRRAATAPRRMRPRGRPVGYRMPPLRVDKRVFDDDERGARRRAHAVVLDHRGRHEAVRRGFARPHGRHRHAIAQRQPRERQRRKQARHVGLPATGSRAR